MRKTVLNFATLLLLAASGLAGSGRVGAQDDIPPLPPFDSQTASPSPATEAQTATTQTPATEAVTTAPAAPPPKEEPDATSDQTPVALEETLATPAPVVETDEQEVAPTATAAQIPTAAPAPDVHETPAVHGSPNVDDHRSLRLPTTPRSRMDRTRTAPTEFLIYQRALQRAQHRMDRLEERKWMGVSPARPLVPYGAFSTNLNTLPGYYTANRWNTFGP